MKTEFKPRTRKGRGGQKPGCVFAYLLCVLGALWSRSPLRMFTSPTRQLTVGGRAVRVQHFTEWSPIHSPNEAVE